MRMCICVDEGLVAWCASRPERKRRDRRATMRAGHHHRRTASIHATLGQPPQPLTKCELQLCCPVSQNQSVRVDVMTHVAHIVRVETPCLCFDPSALALSAGSGLTGQSRFGHAITQRQASLSEEARVGRLRRGRAA